MLGYVFARRTFLLCRTPTGAPDRLALGRQAGEAAVFLLFKWPYSSGRIQATVIHAGTLPYNTFAGTRAIVVMTCSPPASAGRWMTGLTDGQFIGGEAADLSAARYF